jgi:mannose/cellobiose epimerase-like protein (N-acyl-D-glucosamine 2-epimerase family)
MTTTHTAIQDYVAGYAGTPISDPLNPAEIARAVADARRMTVSVINQVLIRYEADPAYGLVDMKLSLLTGKDFDAADPIRGRHTVYGWIQARGLESLATHGLWLGQDHGIPQEIRANLLTRLASATRGLHGRLERLRENAGGRLTFMMDPTGRPVGVDDAGRVGPVRLDLQGRSTLSDLFHAKAVAAAAVFLKDPALCRIAEQRFEKVYTDIARRTLYFDQQPFDPKNPVRQVPGRHILGPLMIGIYGCTWLNEAVKDTRWQERGEWLIRKILAEHCAADTPTGTAGEARIDGLKPGDFFEFVDDNAKPWQENSMLLSDPGHGIEVAGLGLRHLIRATGTGAARAGSWPAESERLAQCLARAFCRNFENGFAATGRGLYKLVDLKTRKPYNSQLPWWSLPEAIRTAAGCALVARNIEDKQRAMSALQKAHNAFVGNFVQPGLHLMAYQALDENGTPLNVIPATPDADPGYHTGLSLIDAIGWLEASAGRGS